MRPETSIEDPLEHSDIYKCFASAKDDLSPWWKAEFKQQYLVKQVNVHVCPGDFHIYLDRLSVYVGDELCGIITYEEETSSYLNEGDAGVRCPGNGLLGSSVKVTRTNTIDKESWSTLALMWLEVINSDKTMAGEQLKLELDDYYI